MEKLTEAQRKTINKTSTVRLTAQLLAAGYDEQSLGTMDRPAMIQAWAELVAAGKEKAPLEVEQGAVGGYDPAVEKQRLEFEMKRWEEEREERRRKEDAEREERRRKDEARQKREEEEREERRLEREERRRADEERRAKEEAERLRAEEERAERRRVDEEKRAREEEEREERRQREQEELEIRKRELQLRQDEVQAHIDRTRERNTLVDRSKRFGAALKGTLARMPADPVDLLSYFRDVEHQFVEYDVPDDLQVGLLRPHLSDRAKLLVSRMDPRQSSDYIAVKAMLLREYKLSPVVYLDRFNTEQRKPEETYLLYTARLTSLLEAYLDSRKIGKRYEKIPDLLVSDRIKSSLSPGCLSHVLSVESTTEAGWLPPHELAEVVEKYMTNRFPQGDRPRAGAIGITTPSKPTNVDNRQSRPMFRLNSANTHSQRSASTPRSTVPNVGKRCFACGSNSHFIRDCPDKRKVKDFTAHKTQSQAQVNACVVHKTPSKQSKQAMPKASNKVDQSVQSDLDQEGNFVAISEQTLSDEPVTMSVATCTRDDFVVESAPLCHVSVQITDTNRLKNNVVLALCDSGAEISVVHSDLVRDFDLPVSGVIKIEGIVGSPVAANLVKLPIRLQNDDGVDDYCVIDCAVCSEFNLGMIVTAEVVNTLQNKHASRRLVSAVTRSQSQGLLLENGVEDGDDDDVVSSKNQTLDAQTPTGTQVVNHTVCDTKTQTVTGESTVVTDNAVDAVPGKANTDQLRKEQQEDESLRGWLALAKKQKGGFYFSDGLLYHNGVILGQSYAQLCIPACRRSQVLELAHDTFGGHLGATRTRDRIRLSFTWPTITSDCKKYCQTCGPCQKRARRTKLDRVPIAPIPRAETPFTHWFMDCLGPIFNHNVEYNYCLVLVDSATRWPEAIPLRSLTAKHVCEALLTVWKTTGIPAVVSSDNASNFTSKLNHEFMKLLGCSPRFNTPGHPQSSGLVERMVGTIKQMINKVAYDHPKQWHKHLGYIVWALREVPNETTGLPPWLLTFGHLPRGPLAVLKETWCGESELPLDLGKNAVDFLKDVRIKLLTAHSYATEQTKREQARHASLYNLHSKDKHFSVGEQVLILTPDSTASKVFSRWKGPATVVEVRSPYSYIVEIDNARQHVHANKLRKFHVRISEVMCDPLSVVEPSLSVNTCAIVYDRDTDFGNVEVVEPLVVARSDTVDLLPSQKIDASKLAHLTDQQRVELLDVLDQYPDCFSDVPGYCNLAEHEIPVTDDFKPRRLKAYKVPEKLKQEVQRQITELLEQGFIRPSKSEMASPLVCVLKGKDGRDGVRLAVDYRYVNKYTVGDAYPMPDMIDVIQRMGHARYISTFDAKSGYWQTPVRQEHQWLTAFVCDEGLFEWVRTPFGMKSSGATFVRAMQQVLNPIRSFSGSYVDDMSVFSGQWQTHMTHLKSFLQRIRECGITLNLKKCHFAKPEVKFCGQLVGSGNRRPDPEKVETIQTMKVPGTKKQVRQMLGFFSWFRDYIPDFAFYAKPLTDLTAKRVPNNVPWGEVHQQAFEHLKGMLCQATTNPLYIVDFNKPFNVFTDASDYAIAGILTQSSPNGSEHPIAFASRKLTDTQRAWSTIEKESYAVLWTLQKYRQWLFGAEVTVYSDHNPITYLTDTAPKSAKLMRWSLAIQEFQVKFKYKAGKTNVAADYLSRVGSACDSSQSLQE